MHCPNGHHVALRVVESRLESWVRVVVDVVQMFLDEISSAM